MEESKKNKVTQTILITEDDRKKLKAIAKDNDTSMSRMVRAMIRTYGMKAEGK